MVLVMTAVFTRQDSFNSVTLLQNQAYEVALDMREAQLYAVSASTINSNSRQAVGVSFNLLVPNLYQIKQHTINAGSGELDTGTAFGPQGVVDNRFFVSELLADGSPIAETVLTVVFERPNFDARFFDAAGDEIIANDVEIVISNVANTASSTVVVTRVGQITVE